MRHRRPARSRLRCARLGFDGLGAKQLLTTFTVTNVADSEPGTLRQAILDVNADADPNAASLPAEIDFAIPDAGMHTIAPAIPLPAVNKIIDIDATTQPGYAGSPLVVLDVVNAASADGSPVVGLQVGTDNTGVPSTMCR